MFTTTESIVLLIGSGKKPGKRVGSENVAKSECKSCEWRTFWTTKRYLYCVPVNCLTLCSHFHFENVERKSSKILFLMVSVSFTAQMTQWAVNVGASSSPLVFDQVVTSIGGGYNPHTGVFTAPVTGLYVFYAQLMNHETHGWMHYGIYKASTPLCLNDLDAGSGTSLRAWDKSSCLATTHLQQGDTVFVHRVNGDANDQVISGGWSASFTGFLLNADSS
jgi:hypothetical protein